MTPKKSYSIKKEDLDKNELERIAMRKEFHFLAFDYGVPVESETFVVMKLSDFKKLYDLYKEENGYED